MRNLAFPKLTCAASSPQTLAGYILSRNQALALWGNLEDAVPRRHSSLEAILWNGEADL